MNPHLPGLPATEAVGSPAGPAQLLPVLLHPQHFRVLVVGSGPLALEKLAAILQSAPEARVEVVGETPAPDLEELAARHVQVNLHRRPFRETDLLGTDLVLVATDDAARNLHIGSGALARGLLTHVAGAASAGNFSLPTAPGSAGQTVAAPRPPAARASQARVGAGESRATAFWRRLATRSLMAFAGFILLNILSYYFTWPQLVGVLASSTTFYLFVAVGFAAQLVDGLLGMGYGVVAAITLMSLGLPPAAVSASIHTAEVFASGASGYHHYRFGNVNRRLFKVLLLPGIAGAIGGALLLSYFGEQYAAWVKPLLAVYLLVLGVRILGQAFSSKEGRRSRIRYAGLLAGAGGFLDSFGGGGWGPLVTSTLISKGRTPQYVIGTVSVTEFFVTFASAFTFFAVLGLSHWQIVLGLIVGGVAAAPLAARLAGRISTRLMFVGVGLMVIFWSLWALRNVFF